MARALGGSAVPNNDNWELGVYEVPLSKFGQEFFGVPTLVRASSFPHNSESRPTE